MPRLLVLAAILSSLVAERQEPFRTRVDLVQVDVVVTDDDRRVVKGLTRDDFELFVDGRPAPIVGFDAVSLPGVSAAPRPRLTDSSGSLVATNDEPMDGRILVLVLDDLFMQVDPRRIYRTRVIARDIIRRLGPGDRMALLSTRGRLHHRVEFTNDLARLEEAVEDFVPGGAVGLDGTPTDETPADAGVFPAERFLHSLRDVMRALRDVPQRRKGLIVIGEASMFVIGGYSPGSSSRHSEVALAYQAMLDEAARSNVAVYSFSTGPMDVYPLGSYTLRYISDDTGGRSSINMNDHSSGVDALYSETGNYYLLGFQPTDWDDKKFRAIEVKVRRPGLRVRARRGFEPSSTKDAITPPGPDRLLASPLAAPTIPLRLAAVPVPSSSKHADVLTAVEISGQELVTAQQIEASVTALDRDGRVRARDRYAGALTGRADPRRWLRIAGRLELAPGRYQLRVAVKAGGAAGSLFTELEVPDPGDEIQVGGLALGTSAQGVARGSTVQALLGIVPIAIREVPARMRATAAIRIRITDPAPDEIVGIRAELIRDGQPMTSLKEARMAATVFMRGGRAEVFPLPENLTPGPITLRVHIEYRGGTHTRDLGFTVTP